MLTIRFDLAASTAEVTCETWVEAACLLGGVVRSKASAQQAVAELLQGATPAPEAQQLPAPKAGKARRKPGRKPRDETEPPKQLPPPNPRKRVYGRSEEEKKALQAERRKRWYEKKKAAQQTGQRSPSVAPPPTQPSQRAELEELTKPKRPREDLIDPDLPRCERKGTKMFGAGTAVLKAFSKSQDYPFEQLAKHIYGSDTFPAMGNLRKLLEQMVYSAKTLKKIGAKSYTLTLLGREALERAEAKAAEQQAGE